MRQHLAAVRVGPRVSAVKNKEIGTRMNTDDTDEKVLVRFAVKK
jgi:hypothetical protein